MATLAKPTGTTTQVATAVAAVSVAVAAVQPLLLTFDALPTWLQDNAFILTGYRRCLVISTTKVVARRCNALDYSGIIVLTVGSFYPCLRYGFFCDPQFQVIYSIGITVAGLAAAYVVLNPQYATPAYRWARTSVFFVLGACSFVPIATAYHLYGLERMKNEMGVHWIALTSVFYVGGALIYVCRVPERWFPGTFDFFGSSHQIFHVCVVLAALSHYQAVLTGFEYWHGKRHGVCPS
ncbi:unnamed protein product [Rhizoctonia solani]|uniref:Uncharacterized protein n=1 Tax=Rhizoctonia solani TaxID=456999 RepID=A0A8H2XPX3_9AGAM|nr:unnamed protein product [Rhizoctonia solani]